MLAHYFRQDRESCKDNIGVVLASIQFYQDKKLQTITGVTKRFYQNWDDTAYQKYMSMFELDEQKQVKQLGGTMRLGQYPCLLAPESQAAALYGESLIYERHRHRYEVNNDFRDQLERAGVLFAGKSPDGRIVEMMEIPDHPWFIAVQFHPEFKSRPNRPHPLFRGFVCAAKAKKGE